MYVLVHSAAGSAEISKTSPLASQKNPVMVLMNRANQHKKQRSLRYLDSFHRYTHRAPPGCQLRYSARIFALARAAAGKGLRVGTSEKSL
jgi:hypothetical protein